VPSFFSVVEDAAQKTADVVRPVHFTVAQLLNSVEAGQIIPLPESSAREIWAGEFLKDFNLPFGAAYGVKINMRAAVDSEGDKTWIKWLQICSRALNAAAFGRDAEVAYRRESSARKDLFIPVSQLPVREDLIGDVLFWAIGSSAYAALAEALRAENYFDPSLWDLDGYCLRQPDSNKD